MRSIIEISITEEYQLAAARQSSSNHHSSSLRFRVDGQWGILYFGGSEGFCILFSQCGVRIRDHSFYHVFPNSSIIPNIHDREPVDDSERNNLATSPVSTSPSPHQNSSLRANSPGCFHFFSSNECPKSFPDVHEVKVSFECPPSTNCRILRIISYLEYIHPAWQVSTHAEDAKWRDLAIVVEDTTENLSFPHS